MAKIERSKGMKKQKQEEIFPLVRTNFIILGIGIATIIIGYIALSGNTVESFRQLTVAPILLVIGYCIIIPVGIMYRKKKQKIEVPPPPQVNPQ